MVRMQRMIADAADYARADKSDPFTFARCMAHLRSGMGRWDNDGRDAHYKATPFVEMKPSPMGLDYPDYAVTTYRNVERI